MDTILPRDDLRPLAALSLVAAPLLLLAGDTLGLLSNHGTIPWTVVLWLAFVAFVPAVFTLARLVRTRAPRTGLVLGAMALVGTMAGAAMQAFFRADIALRQAGDAAAIAAAERAWSRPAIPLTTLVPGLFFPLGMLALGIALAMGGRVPRGAGLLLAAGGVLFPIGHAAGMPVPLVAGDLVLLAALAWIASAVRRGA